MIASRFVTATMEYPSISRGDIANLGEISEIHHFLDPEKTTLIFALQQPFQGPDGVNQVTKFTSI